VIHVLHIVLGLALGALGGAAHLWLVRLRARRAVTHASGVMLLYPVGLAALALPVFLATQIAPVAAWASLPGVVLVRWLSLRALTRPRRRGAP